MSSSRHPIALRLEQQVGGATKLLATVMLLPLIDGIFPALVLAGALSSTVGILQLRRIAREADVSGSLASFPDEESAREFLEAAQAESGA